MAPIAAARAAVPHTGLSPALPPSSSSLSASSPLSSEDESSEFDSSLVSSESSLESSEELSSSEMSLALRVPHLDWMSSSHLGSSMGSPAFLAVHCLKASWQTRE